MVPDGLSKGSAMFSVTDHSLPHLEAPACRSEIQRITGEMQSLKEKFFAGDDDAGYRHRDLAIWRGNYEARLVWLAEFKSFTTAPRTA
jgi:hypothetical protein